MQKNEFYQNHLNHVSRSFAFCIARLNEPLRGWVSLAYLLCRVLDTAEDSAWSRAEQKQNAFISFNSFLSEAPEADRVQSWIAGLPEGIKKEERLLTQDFGLLLADFHALPPRVRESLRLSITGMSNGMRFFSGKNAKNELILSSLSEVNSYCFFVAGLVGELLTDLLKELVPEKNFTRDVYLKAHHFGLFLQKINLLKDQKDDEAQGRFLVPDREALKASLVKNAAGAVDYITGIPARHKEFRLFCAWSLFLGLSSLDWMESLPKTSLLGGISAKLPRWMTERLLSQVEDIIENDQALRALFQRMLKLTPRPDAGGTPGEWPLARFYQGVLGPSELADLGLI